MDIYRWVVKVLGNAGAVANAATVLERRQQEDRIVAVVAAHVA
jgi:hypothetical protein